MCNLMEHVRIMFSLECSPKAYVYLEIMCINIFLCFKFVLFLVHIYNTCMLPEIHFVSCISDINLHIFFLYFSGF